MHARFRTHGPRLLLAVAAALAATLAVFSLLPAIRPVDADGATPATGNVSVRGGHLLRDGVPWLPRGVQIVGLVAPDRALRGRYVSAHAHFGTAELEAARAAHADLIRFQVSQYGLDPRSRLYSRAYVREVQDSVRQARALGLSVIVSLQSEMFAGRFRRCPMPDAAAQRVWRELAPMFAGDPGVMYELFNEPALSSTPADWRTWKSGGPAPAANGGVCQAVGMQTLIDEIRAYGADNVIIVPGLGWERSLAGMPALHDPASPSNPQLAYGIHYPSLAAGSPVWDSTFGNVSARVPVIVTEWYASSFLRSCSPDDPSRAAWLLDYLASKQIGVVAYSFDVPGSIVSNWSYSPTSYSGYACQIPPTPAGAIPRGGPHKGPGQLLFTEFAGLARAGSPSLGIPRAWVVSQSAIRGIELLAPGLARDFLNTPRTFVIGSSAASLRQLGLPAAIPTTSFTSEAALAAAIRQHALPAGTRAVAFVDQYWSSTPRAEQLHPSIYYQRAAELAHSYGLMLVAAPAPALVLARTPRLSPGLIYARFLDRRIAAGVARYADVFATQAQGLETRYTAYTAFVRQASLQASAAHPGVELLAGLSSTQPGRQHSASELLAAAGGTGPRVSGYWLADPSPGGSCSACSGSSGAVAVSFLRGLRSQSSRFAYAYRSAGRIR